MTSDERRARVDALRTKVATALDKLNERLDDDGHDVDCVMRCFETNTDHGHDCVQCELDGEV